GAQADYLTVSSGGTLVVAGGGETYEETVSSGGKLVISSGGLEYNGVISGGAEVVASGATIFGDSVYGGGSALVQSGGVISSQEVIYDGTMTVAAGGSAAYVILESGTLEVASGGAVGTVNLWNSGGIDTLVLDAATSFHGTVAGFGAGDQIDLEDIAFAPTLKKGQVTFSSNTLTVTDGTHTASIHLLGAYMASELVASSDGHGGTLITFTSAASTTGGNGHGNAIASPVTS
ncbi:MAG: hypothetical protein J2P17_31235, partial [Mycobacterium sp.]|nr:hypothetical protein [Mycobacterium sp.]